MNTTTPFYYAIYTRQSKSSDAVMSSCDAQFALCEDFIKMRAAPNWQWIGERLDDEQMPGDRLHRPGLDRLREQIRAGTVQYVVVYALDRLSRKMTHCLQLLNEMLEHDVEFSVVLNPDLDTTTGKGQVMTGVLAALAEFEHDLIKSRIRDKFDFLRKKGRRLAGRAQGCGIQREGFLREPDRLYHSFRETRQGFLMDSTEIHFLEPVELTLPDFPAHGPILDVGGGGEGMIGRLKGRDVVAIDLCEDELLEAPEGPLKTVMDARALAFPDSAFPIATAFFSFMYVDGEANQQTVFNEIYRVLRPGEHLHIWDIDLSERPETEKSVFAIPVKCRIGNRVYETGYGRPWHHGSRDSAHYAQLAQAAGFQRIEFIPIGSAFYACFQK